MIGDFMWEHTDPDGDSLRLARMDGISVVEVTARSQVGQVVVVHVGPAELREMKALIDRAIGD